MRQLYCDGKAPRYLFRGGTGKIELCQASKDRRRRLSRHGSTTEASSQETVCPVATVLKGHHPSLASVICPLPHPRSIPIIATPVRHPTLHVYMHSCITVYMSLPLMTAAVWRPKHLAELFLNG